MHINVVVNNAILYEVLRSERFQTAKKRNSASLMVPGNGAIRYAGYDFLLVFDYSYASILHCFWDIIKYISTSYLHLALHPLLLLLGHLHHHLLKLLIAPFGMFHHVSGINSLYLFVNLILDQFLHFLLTHSFTHHFVLFCFTTLLTPSLIHYRLETYLFHKSYIRSSTSSYQTASKEICPHHFFWANRFPF